MGRKYGAEEGNSSGPEEPELALSPHPLRYACH